MRKTFKKLVLLAVGLASGCKKVPDAHAVPLAEHKKARQPAPAPLLAPAPKAPLVVVGRPPNMPCQIFVKHALPNGEYDPHATAYHLSYGPGGRLESATQWAVRIYCIDNPDQCEEARGTETLSLQYQYDDQGRLVGAIAPRDGGQLARMTMAYDAANRVARYMWAEPRARGQMRQRETTLAFDSSGHPSAMKTKGKTFSKNPQPVLELSSMEGAREPFTEKPIIWPDSPHEVFFGWTHKVVMGKVEGFNVAEMEEIVRYDDAGRIRSSIHDFQGKSHHLRIFVYDGCSDERGQGR